MDDDGNDRKSKSINSLENPFLRDLLTTFKKDIDEGTDSTCPESIKNILDINHFFELYLLFLNKYLHA